MLQHAAAFEHKRIDRSTGCYTPYYSNGWTISIRHLQAQPTLHTDSPAESSLAREVVHSDGRHLEIREDTDFNEASRVLTIVWRLLTRSIPTNSR